MFPSAICRLSVPLAGVHACWRRTAQGEVGRRGRGESYSDVILRLEASGEASWREAARPSRDGRRQKAACGRWAFSSARAQMSLCLSPHHLALQFYEFGPFGGALNGPPGE